MPHLRLPCSLPTRSPTLRNPPLLTRQIQQQQQQQQQHRHICKTASLRSAPSHEDHYDPPSGWLFGVPPGEKYKKEGWETIWVWGFYGSLALGVVGYAYRPDSSIQTWALEEARRRLEAEGILPDPEVGQK